MGIINLFQPAHEKYLSKSGDIADILFRVTKNEMELDFIKSLRLSANDFMRFKLFLYVFNLSYITYFIQKECNWSQESLDVVGDVLVKIVDNIILYDSDIEEKFYDLIHAEVKASIEKEARIHFKNFDDLYKLNTVSRRRELLKTYFFREIYHYWKLIRVDKSSNGFGCLTRFIGSFYEDEPTPIYFTQNFDNVIRHSSITIFSEFISKV